MGDILLSYQIIVILEVKEEVFVVVCVLGIVEYIFVEEGDYVEKGQVFVQFDKKCYELNLSKVCVDFIGIEKELSKIKKVYFSKLVSDDIFDKFIVQYEVVKVVLVLVELDLKEIIIIVFISGYIVECNVKVGNFIELFQCERMFYIVQ